MGDNLTIYNLVRQPPKEALKEIKGGRLSGKTDINPMWRLKALTEQFGMCGIGWKYVITKQWLEAGGKDEQAAFVNIDLFIKVEGEWSDAIPGTGGSSFVAAENKGLYTSDECFKMALTDAISVSCKALGFAADVYWNSDSTKYNKPGNPTEKEVTKPIMTNKPKADNPIIWPAFWANIKKQGYTEAQVHEVSGVESIAAWSRDQVNELMEKLKAKYPKTNQG